MKSKNIVLTLLAAFLVIEVGVFGWWVLKDPSFKSLFFPPQAEPIVVEEKHDGEIKSHVDDNRVFNKNIQAVNSSVKEMIANVPETLAQELDASRLYFMLRNKGGLTVRSFVFDNDEFTESNSEAMVDHFYSYSPSFNKLAYLAVADDPSEEYTNERLYEFRNAQVYVADGQQEQSRAFPLFQFSSKVSESDLPFKQYLSVSDGGSVLLNAGGMPDHDEHSVGKAGDASIYLVKDGKTEFLTHGFMPQWINEEEFVFFKNDGVYKAAVGRVQESLIIPADEGTNIEINNRLDVSSDGRLIAWMQPQHQKLVVHMLNLDTQKYEQHFVAAERGYWAEISPSGKFIAVQTTDPSRTGEEQNPDAKIEFYDLTTMQKVPNFEISLDMFYHLSMFMTEWAKK